mgnify:CR=1 FL=1
MLYKELIELFDMLDSASASGSEVVEYFRSIDPMCQVETYPLEAVSYTHLTLPTT